VVNALRGGGAGIFRLFKNPAPLDEYPFLGLSYPSPPGVPLQRKYFTHRPMYR
jgi:hypothetical protein